MARAFNRADVTLAADTAVSISALLVAEGYTGRHVGAFMEIDPQAVGDLRMAESATDIGTTGRLMDAPFSRAAMPPVDPSRYYLHSTTGGEIGLTFEPM